MFKKTSLNNIFNININNYKLKNLYTLVFILCILIITFEDLLKNYPLN